MNYFTARKILDLVREGRDYPVFIINQALYIVTEITEEQYEFRNFSPAKETPDAAA